MSAKVSAKKSLKQTAVLLGSAALVGVLTFLGAPEAAESLTVVFVDYPKILASLPLVYYAAAAMLDAWKHKGE